MASGILLDIKAEKFAQSYVTYKSIAKAAVAAGVAPNTGSNWMKRVDIQLRIEALKLEVIESCGMTREDVIRGLEEIAQADPQHLLSIQNMKNLSQEQAAAIDTVEIEESNIVIDGAPHPVTKMKVKAVNKNTKRAALRDLAEYHNIFEDHQKSGAGEMHVTIEGKFANL